MRSKRRYSLPMSAASTPSEIGPTGQRELGIFIVRASWISTAVFGLLVIPPAFGFEPVEGLSVGVSMLYLLLSMVIWSWALVLAAVRTTRGDDVQIASLFLVQGDVKETPRFSLYLSLGASIAITAVGATADPFVVLAPMLPLGLVGLWGARNGVYPARGGVALRPKSANAQNLGSDPQERS